MATQIFVNLPVKELDRSVEFFTKLDFTFDPRAYKPVRNGRNQFSASQAAMGRGFGSGCFVR